jgi:threonine dehydratase
MALLTAMDPGWNISLFHYRNHGADVGRVLVGMQVPGDGPADLGGFFASAGYRFTEETGHPAYSMFLGSHDGT